MKQQTLQDLSLTDLDVLYKRILSRINNIASWLQMMDEYGNHTNRNSGPLLVGTPPFSKEDVEKYTKQKEIDESRLKLIATEIELREEAIFETKPVVDISTDKGENAMWLNLLGFTPEMIRHTDDHNNCLNCNSTALKRYASPPWTSKQQCGTCGYFTYIVHQDKMGTVMPDDVALDMRESTMIPRKSSTET